MPAKFKWDQLGKFESRGERGQARLPDPELITIEHENEIEGLSSNI